ncbi:MAG: hypothetical protein A4E25_00040 [Methanobacterium sp. PtaB.Bin024]|nr:MAG: hypothetical protein A4E25_00040 [Methanobacterium sp. PtaB.Bin024]
MLGLQAVLLGMEEQALLLDGLILLITMAAQE